MTNSNQQQFSDLERSVLRTLAFFDIFDYPLTLVELHKWLYQPARQHNLSDILTVVQSENLKGIIQHQFGFYFFAGRQAIIRIRLERYQIAEKKFKIALKTVRFLRWLSVVEMVAVCNNVGYNNGTEKSDIDFFMIISKGRLWWGRLMITLITTILGVRRHGVRIVDRVCLSFYTATNHLNLTDISLKPLDPYLVYWFATLAPIYSKQKTYQNFMAANDWLKTDLPNFYQTHLTSRREITDSPLVVAYHKLDRFFVTSWLGRWAERFAQLIETRHVKGYLGDAMNQNNTHVIISSDMLKFHKIDRRDQYRQAFLDRLIKLRLV
ncbi:MAG: hypothetical protein HUU49_03420 [Candidatus Buchananbacteria bacterium]|nr:hypothetical protein [Candidatus Buchananbacteria bacterium]